LRCAAGTARLVSGEVGFGEIGYRDVAARLVFAISGSFK
jgi:hypothetical protein